MAAILSDGKGGRPLERVTTDGPRRRSFAVPHPWRLSPAEARAVQLELRHRVIVEDRYGPIRRVAGVDLGFVRQPDGPTLGRAVVVVVGLPDLETLEAIEVLRPVEMPYIPGLLSFRESPVALAAFERLEHLPDLVMVDGHGRAHPRRFGIACHLGVLLDLPAIGVAKSVLVGRAEVPADQAGATAPLIDDDEVVGMAVRTRLHTKPVYVSVGHRVTLASAVKLVLACVRQHRLPEPTRRADLIASRRGL